MKYVHVEYLLLHTKETVNLVGTNFFFFGKMIHESCQEFCGHWETART